MRLKRNHIDEETSHVSLQPASEPWWLRLLLVLSGMSPLFLLWAIRGSSLVPDFWLLIGCCMAFALSNLFVALPIFSAKRSGSTRRISIDSVDNRRSDVLAYLFAMMLPFYSVSLNEWRDLAATAVAFAMVVGLFVGLRMHYLNLWLIVLGFHCYEVSTAPSKHSENKTARFVVITKNGRLESGDSVSGYAVTPNFILEL